MPLSRLSGLATSTAARGHGMAGSGETTALRLEWVTLRASAALLGPSARERRGWEGHGGGCPRGATTPAMSAMAAVEGNCDFALTKAQLDRRWGGEGRGDHGKATDELGNMFSQWRACTTTATLGREWRAAADLALRAEKARAKQWGWRVRSGRHWPSSRARTRDVVALAEHERHAASSS